MDAPRLPAAVLAAAGDRRGGALEVAATAVDGLLEVADDPPLLVAAVAALLAGQPAMAPIWHLANAAHAPDPPSALADLRHHLANDADAAVATATAWLLTRRATAPGAVATISHSSLVARVLASLAARAADARRPAETAPEPASDRGRVPRWGSVADPGAGGAELSTAPVPTAPVPTTPVPTTPVPTAPSVGVVGADAVGPEALLNAVGTLELAVRLPTLVVATAVKLVPAEVFGRLGGPGFEAVPLAAVAAVVVGPEVLSPAEAGRRARRLAPGPPGRAG